MENICIIGLGNMGKAIFEILKKKKTLKVIGCERGDDVNKALKNCDAFVVAVKPQDFGKLCSSIKIDLSQKLAISIMAGMSIKSIADGLHVEKVVRVMPNLPLRIKKALSGWFANEKVTSAEKKFVKNVFSEFGSEVEVDKEEKINMILSLSACGPAYFFKLTEILNNVAVKYGFTEEEARKISESTFVGAALLLEDSKESAASLREKVTSKGGTTKAALDSMDSNNIDKIVIEGIESARRRAEELNK